MGGYTYLMGDPERAPLSLPGHYPEYQSAGFGFAAANACRFAGGSESDFTLMAGTSSEDWMPCPCRAPASPPTTVPS